MEEIFPYSEFTSLASKIWIHLVLYFLHTNMLAGKESCVTASERKIRWTIYDCPSYILVQDVCVSGKWAYAK